MITELNKANFDEFVAKGIAVIDFWASWCGPCKMISPILDGLSGEEVTIKFAKVNVDEQSELANKL